jgi:hypothetical protein
MREHLRSLIEQARQEVGSRTNGPDAGNTTTITDRLGRDAVRLARLAVAMHLAETVTDEFPLMKNHRVVETQSGAEHVLNCLDAPEVSERSERPVENHTQRSSSLCASMALRFSPELQECER